MRVLLAWNGPATLPERAVLARREVPLLVRLTAQGVQPVVVLFGDEAGLHHDLEAAHIDVRVVSSPLPPSADALLRLPGATMRLRRLITKIDPDILEGSEPMPSIALGVAAQTLRHRGVVVYRRHHGGGRKRLHVASRIAARLAESTIVSCEAMRQLAFTGDRTPLDRIFVASSGSAEPRRVAPDEIAAARRSLGIGADARVIGVISRLRREKGIDILLSALDRISSSDTHVVIAGTGPEEPHLRELAARSPIPVHFVGHREDVEVWFAVADVIVMPSKFESLGRVTIESMAAGRPLVAARVGGLADAVVDGETGVLVPPDDPAALAAALRPLLEDRALARRYGAAARARYESAFTIEHMATARREAWERILNR